MSSLESRRKVDGQEINFDLDRESFDFFPRYFGLFFIDFKLSINNVQSIFCVAQCPQIIVEALRST